MPRRWWLFLFLLPALPAQESPKVASAATLEREFTEAQKTWSQRLREAREAGDQEALKEISAARPEREFQKRFQQGAEANAGTPAAVAYLAWLVSRGASDVSKASLTKLMESHVEDPGIRLAVARIGGIHQVLGKEQSRAWLDLVLEKNADPQVRAQAHFTRGAMYVGTRAVERSEALRKMAIADLMDAIAIGSEKSISELAGKLLYEAQKLEVGLKAPEIEGEDLDGKPFKLSDYRGKVVLLDFWGDW